MAVAASARMPPQLALAGMNLTTLASAAAYALIRQQASSRETFFSIAVLRVRPRFPASSRSGLKAAKQGGTGCGGGAWPGMGMPGPIICAAALMVRPSTAIAAIGTRRIAIIPAPGAPRLKVRDTLQRL